MDALLGRVEIENHAEKLEGLFTDQGGHLLRVWRDRAGLFTAKYSISDGFRSRFGER